MPQLVARTTIRKDRGEYRVRAYDANNKRMPESDYFTDDKSDAQDTATAMLEPYRANVARRLKLAHGSFAHAMENAEINDFTDTYGHNVSAILYAQEMAHHARLLLEHMSVADVLLRTDVLSNDELTSLYHDTTGDARETIADAIRERARLGIIKPSRGNSYYSGAPDYRCGHCGVIGGH